MKFIGDERALLQALRARHPGAIAAFYDQHAAYVHRVLRSVLGSDAGMPELLREVFVRAVDGVREIDELERVRSWLTSLAIYTARAYIRRRSRPRWLRVFSKRRAEAARPEPSQSDVCSGLGDVYRLLDGLPVEQRLAFTVHVVHGMSLAEAAEVTGVSLATFKSRLVRGQRSFLEAARQRPALLEWLEKGTRWTLQKQG